MTSANDLVALEGPPTQQGVAVARTARSLSLAFLACALLACPNQDRRLTEHVLQRVAYGPSLESMARLHDLGVDAWIDEQLHPETIPDRRVESALAAAYPSLRLSLQQLEQGYGDDGTLGEYWRPLDELREAKVIRAVRSERQLEAILTDFWFDHFNVQAEEGVTVHGVVTYERDAIRPNVLGRFEDLLRGVARSPAMLDYLDNDVNVKEVIDEVGNRIQGLNENWARELMELHTLGVDGGYTQEDVIAVARAFTGWTVAHGPDGLTTPDGFTFDAAEHDIEEKALFGGALVIPPGGGIDDAEAVIRYLASHPTTAQRVSRLLTQRFVDEAPPQRLVDEAAARFLATDGDLREVMRTILFSPEFRDVSRHRGKVKRPLVLLASMLRASESDPAPFAREILDALDDLGEDLYAARPPTGYPDASGYWSNGGALVKRANEATWHASQGLARHLTWGVGGGTPGILVNLLSTRLVPGGLSETSRAAIVAYLEGLPAWVDDAKRVEEAAGLLLSTPEFQLH